MDPINGITIHNVSLKDFQSLLNSLKFSTEVFANANEAAILQALEDFVNEGEEVLGAYIKGKLVGLIRYGVEDFHTHDQAQVEETLIGIIFVHPLYRDRGIGKLLVDYARSHALTTHIVADPLNKQAHLFFANCGFQTNHIYDLDDGGDWLMISKTTYEPH